MKSRERILLGIFTALFAVIIGGGLVMYSLKSYRSISAENDGMRQRVASMNAMLSQSAVWQQRSEWLMEHIPNFGSREEASSRLLDIVQTQAQSAGIIISSRELVPAAKGADDGPAGYFEKVSMKLSLTDVGEKQFFTWMHSLQQPAAFLGITNLEMTCSMPGRTVNCEVQVTQFYREVPAPKITKAP